MIMLFNHEQSKPMYVDRISQELVNEERTDSVVWVDISSDDPHVDETLVNILSFQDTTINSIQAYANDDVDRENVVYSIELTGTLLSVTDAYDGVQREIHMTVRRD